MSENWPSDMPLAFQVYGDVDEDGNEVPDGDWHVAGVVIDDELDRYCEVTFRGPYARALALEYAEWMRSRYPAEPPTPEVIHLPKGADPLEHADKIVIQEIDDLIEVCMFCKGPLAEPVPWDSEEDDRTCAKCLELKANCQDDEDDEP